MLLILENDFDREAFSKSELFLGEFTLNPRLKGVTIWWSPDAYLQETLKGRFTPGSVTFDDVNNVKQLLTQLSGFSSMCWAPAPEGEFLPEMALHGVDAALDRLTQLISEKIGGTVND